MLLSLMRKHAKSWLIKLLIGIIAMVFIFYFGYSFTAKEGVKVATVNGEIISGLEYQKSYKDLLQNLQRDYKSVWNDNLIKVFDLENRALERLIDQKLLSQEARRIGLDITEKEIQDDIIANPAFQFRGRFDENRYRTLLANNRLKPKDFENIMAQDLLQQKLKQFISAFIPVSNQEVLDQYTFSNQKVKISFVQFSPKDFKGSVTLDQDSMEDYFKEHREGYRIPEKVKISYMTIDPDLFRDKVTIDDRKVKEYYEDNIDIFELKKQVQARHILFKLASDASPEEDKRVRDKALKVIQEARSNEDFAALAKKYSEGPTKDKGGDLGYFSKGRMVKPFEEAVFKMEKGQISDPVRTVFGYHIIKVEDIKGGRTKGLEEVRKQISDTLIRNESADMAHEKALSLMDQMPYDVDLSQYAKQHNFSVSQSAYFSQDETIPEIGGDQKLRQSIFSYEKGDVSELLEFKGKFYIIQVLDKKPSYLPEIGEVSDQVNEDFQEHLASLEAKSAAEGYLAKLREGKGWDELAKEHGIKPETTALFSIQDMPPKIGYAPDLQETLFSLDEDNRYADRIFESDNGALVIRWEGKEEINEDRFQKEKERYRNSLILTKQEIIFRNWLENLKMIADIDRSPFEGG